MSRAARILIIVLVVLAVLGPNPLAADVPALSHRVVAMFGNDAGCVSACGYDYRPENVVKSFCRPPSRSRAGTGFWCRDALVPVRQRFTGKERDAESGLDYFGARYFSGAQGRFTSPDPLLNSGRPWDPQSWNRYAYVGNNPLRYTDPLGLYKWATNCEETEGSQCKAERDRFREALTNVKKAAGELEKGSKERKKLEDAIKRIGQEGKGSTRVAFGDAGRSDAGPNLGLTVGNKMTVNFGAIDQSIQGWQLNRTEAGALDAGVVGHEGAHLGREGLLTEFLTMHGEHDAYYAESAIYQGLRNTDRPTALWNESWRLVDKQVIEQRREDAIQRILHPPPKQPQQQQGKQP